MVYSYNREQEINEAIQAGENALRSLQEAEAQLDSARNWGLLDIFGGNAVSGMVKHMKVSNANQYIDRAKNDLSLFARELDDIRGVENLHVNISGFLTFADFFFDGFIADLYVQSKINEGRRQIQAAIIHVEDMIDELERNL